MPSLPGFACLSTLTSASNHAPKFRRKLFELAAAYAAVAIVGFALSATLQAQQAPQVLHSHVRPDVSSRRAALVGDMPADQVMSLSIVLPLRNQADLTSLLGRLYDPASPDFHHFLSVEQFTAQFSPTAEDYQTVVAFAQANGFTVTDTPANRLLVPIKGTVAQVNQAFGLTMGLYQHPTENRSFYSADREPTLNLSVPVKHIAGLDNFSIPRPMLG